MSGSSSPSSPTESSQEVRASRHSQRDRIVRLLSDNVEVASPRLAEVSLQYSARIFELRRMGYVITNRVVVIDGVKHGFFRLVATRTPESGVAAPTINDSEEKLEPRFGSQQFLFS